MKLCVLGCGLRTPLLLHGLIHSGLGIDEVALYDIDSERSQLMEALGIRMAEAFSARIVSMTVLEDAIQESSFVISSIRVGNIKTRAADERLALECGFAGQETTGPAGFAMALRTIPVAIEYARVVERIAPSAWIVNFTNPAGIITQAISTHTGANVIGICDTPAELFFQIARALGEPFEQVRCGYFGLNHLGWVRSVQVRGEERIGQLLEDDRKLQMLYPSHLFDGALIRALGVIPTEYLFFYYNQSLARQNQLRAGLTRGEELETLNREIWMRLEAHNRSSDPREAVEEYKRYLNRRNASYMKLEGEAGSAFNGPDPGWNPFEGATGYHRIAVDAIRALTNAESRSLILNVPNHGAIEDLASQDVIEVPCAVDRTGPRPSKIGRLPEPVRGLVVSVKYYERLAIQAAIEKRWDTAAFALTMNPIVGSWDAARRFLEGLELTDPQHFSNFQSRDILHSVSF
jgi:6-phospho-beta-glucosidase